MGRIFRTNIFTGEREWVDFEPGVTRFGEGGPQTMTVSPWSKIRVFQGAGCHPSQVQEFNEKYRRLGITGAYHNESGDLVVEGSKRSYNAVLKARGLFNRDAGYSDWAGNNNSTPTPVDTLKEWKERAKSDPDIRRAVHRALVRHR